MAVSDATQPRMPIPGSTDVHTHVGIDPGFYLRNWWPYASTAQDLLVHMDAAGIERAVCFPFTLPSAFDIEGFARDGRVELLPGRIPFDRENALLAEEISRISPEGRLIQFAMFDPFRKVPEQLKLLEQIRGQIHGLKTQTTILQSPISALLGEGRALMEFAAEQRLPVLFHTSIHRADIWAQTSDCLAVAEAFPQVRFNLAHSLRFHEPSLRRAAQLANVWVDCSAHLNHCALARDNIPAVATPDMRVDADYTRPVEVLRAVHAMLGGKYMWGSDNPFMSWCANSLRLIFSYREEADVLHQLPQDVRHDMVVAAPHQWLHGA